MHLKPQVNPKEKVNPKIVLVIIGCIFIFCFSESLLFTWKSVAWKGEKENPEKIVYNAWVKSSSVLPAEEYPVESLYLNLEWSKSQLKPVVKAFQFDLKVKKQKLSFPEKRPFSNFFFKDRLTDNIRYMDRAHGLFANGISSVESDDDGYIWLGSDFDGLVRTNGEFFWNFKLNNGLKSNSIGRIFKCEDGKLWVTWETGLSYIQGDSIYHIENQFFNDVRITRVRNDKHGNTWILTVGKGAFKINGNSIERYNVSRGLTFDDPEDIAFGENGEIYLVSIPGGMNIIKGSDIEVVRDKEKKIYEFAPIALHKSKDRVWIGTFAGSYFYLKQGRITKVKFNKGFERCFDIRENQFGIWFSDYASGVTLLRKDGRVKKFKPENGLVQRNAISIAFDHNKNVWVADPFYGLSKISPSPFSKKTQFGNAVTSISKDYSGQKWISYNGNGVSKIEEGKLININMKPGKDVYTNDHSWDIVPKKDGEILISTHAIGIASIIGDAYHVNFFKKGNVIYDIEEGQNGEYWFSTGGVGAKDGQGLRKWIPQKDEYRLYTTKDGLTSNNVKSCKLDSVGRLWICTDRGINILKENRIAVIDEKKGLSSNDINRVVFDQKGRAWVATNGGGLDVIVGQKILHFDQSSGLIDNRILAIHISKDRKFWLMTPSGLSVLKETGKNEFEIKNYGIEYGSFMLGFTGAVFEESDGKILFGTVEGTVEFDPYFDKGFRQDAKFTIESISINGLKIDSGDEVSCLNSDQLRIDYSILFWDECTKPTLSYAFVKKDQKEINWVNIRKNDPILLNKLEKGKRRLLIRMRNQENVQYFQGPTFDIQPPWFQSNLFYAGIIGLLILMAYFTFRWRFSYLNKKKLELEHTIEVRTLELKREKERLEKANNEIEASNEEKDVVIYEMHHRVKNNLQTISSLLDMQMRSLKNEDGIAAMKDAVRRISAMSTSHELLYSSDALSNISFKSFLTHLITSQSQLLVDDYSSSIVECEIEDFAINVTDCISIGMIVSEAISNSVKHAFGSTEKPKIFIIAKRVGDECEFTISDNGPGAIPDLNKETGKGLGIRLMKIFTAKLKGKIKLNSSEDGLKITINFPCRYND